jgi:predicted lipoprotein with Yx(FWY)xxD motif
MSAQLHRPAWWSATAFGIACIAVSSAHAAPLSVQPTTPPGITMIEVVKDKGGGQPVFLWLRPGDATGRTLLSSDADRAGVSNCTGECAREHPPLVAMKGAKAFGDWSLVHRADGALQWAYQTRPLYTWTKEGEPGEVATNVGVSETSGIPSISAAFAEREGVARLMPETGWKVVRFTPEATLTLPDAITAQMVPSAQGLALTEVGGLTLYAFDGQAKHDGQTCGPTGCELRWIPLAAATLALPVGDFSIVTRADGSRQWAYGKRPLYAYAGDRLPGDANGIGVDSKWTVALITADFRPTGVAVTALDGYGDVMSVRGMTLYGGYPFEHRIGGRNQRDDFTHSAYDKGKKLGPAACEDSTCAKLWEPFSAPANSPPNGFWETIERRDGTHQWVYKGYAMYRYRGDKAPGDHTGQAIYDFAKNEGSEPEITRTLFLVNLSQVKAGAGIYWNIAKP